MMKFIDNNHVIVVCIHTFPKFLTVKGLYRNEKMFCRGRSISTHCQFTNGCRGNTQGLAKMVEGQNAKDVMNRLRGIQCRGNTSCPDQLSRAIEQYYQQHAE